MKGMVYCRAVILLINCEKKNIYHFTTLDNDKKKLSLKWMSLINKQEPLDMLS